MPAPPTSVSRVGQTRGLCTQLPLTQAKANGTVKRTQLSLQARALAHRPHPSRRPGLPAGDGAIPVLQGQLPLLQLHDEAREVFRGPAGQSTLSTDDPDPGRMLSWVHGPPTPPVTTARHCPRPLR